MTRQPLGGRIRVRIPHIHDAVVARAGQVRSRWTPRHLTDHGRELASHPMMALRRSLEHLDAMAVGTAGQPPPIRTPRQVVETVAAVIGVPEHTQTSPRGWLPQANSIVPFAAGQPLAVRT